MNRGVLSRLIARIGAARELFGWWRGEVRDLAQAALRQLPSRKTPELVLRVSATSMSVERHKGAQNEVIGTVPMGDDGSWPAELLGLAPELRGARAAIALPGEELHTCEFELPLAAERHLSAVLRLQLERNLPMPLDQLLMDRQIAARDRKRDLLRVRVVIAHRDRVEALRERVTGWGLTPVSAGVIAADGTPEFNLLKRRRDPIRWLPTPLDLRLLKAAAAAAAVLIVLVGVQWTRERFAVNERIAELRAQAQKIAAARAEVSARAEPLLALQSIVASTEAPELLSKLSTAGPASAWFSHVDLTTPVGAPATLKLTGSVTSQEEVIAALNATPGIRNLKSTSAFNGEILARERLELTAEFAPVADKP
jgi:hypothetical protein